MKFKLEDISNNRITKEQAEEMQKYLQQGGTWAEMLDIEPEKVNEVYAKAYRLYNNQEFDQALAMFSTLIQLNPYVPTYWFGIGASLQGQKIYEEALISYEMVLALDPEYIDALFYAAECQFFLEKKEECKELLKKVISLKEKNPSLAEKAVQILVWV